MVELKTFVVPPGASAFDELVNSIRKFGAITALNGTADVYDNGVAVGAYPFPSTATVASVVSTSAADDGNPEGTGAHSVLIQGLDANYNSIEEVVTLEGLGTATSAKVFLRVQSADIFAVGSGETNAGTITITVDGGIVGQIGLNTGRTLQTIYTVPAEKQLLLIAWGADTEANTSMSATLFTRKSGMPWTIADRKYNRGGGSIFHRYGQLLPMAIPEKTDMRVEAVTGGASSTSAIIDGLIIPQNYPAGS